jgi:hypothetical protein
MTIDELANIIRQVDGNHSLGAGALAEAIMNHPSFVWPSRAIDVAIDALDPDMSRREIVELRETLIRERANH